MSIFFERTVRQGNREYRIAADLDDAAIVDDALRIAIQAAVRDVPDGNWVEESVELVVSVRLSNVQVSVHGQVVATVPLNLPLDDVTDFLGNGLDILKDDGLIEHAIGPAGIEQLIHLIPADPLFGCIVKSAVSTVVGQTIRCWRASSNAKAFRDRIRDIGSCLREYGLRMALTFMYRAGRCAVLAGMG